MGNIIENVKSFNFLGIVIDETLSWKDHVSYISTKISRTNGVINRLKHFLPKSALVSIYHSLIGSHINYGILVWGYNHDRINKLQKKAIRIINCAKYNAHTAPLFKKDKLLTFNEMKTLKILTFYYKLINDLIPSFFISFKPVMVSSSHHYNTRGVSFSVPFFKKAWCGKRLRISLIKNLNNLPTTLFTNIATISLACFKRIVKDFLNNVNVCDT